MKLTTVLLTITLVQVSAAGFAQKVTYVHKNATPEQIFKEIRKQTGYNILVSSNKIKSIQRMDANFKDASIKEVLDQTLQGQSLTYEIDDKTVLIKEKQLSVFDYLRSAFFIPVTISGKVTDTLGLPIPGATVAIKSKSIATVTGKDGIFNIQGDKGDILSFSFIGYKTQTYTVESANPFLNIILHEVSSSLNDVVVVGYGQEKKIDLTGSIVTLNAAQMENRGEANIPNLLAGQAPGVTVIQGGGSPGRDQGSINIQGIGTLGNASPLIVVDGIKTTDYTEINPNDVESISILKDAASSAIYGIDAANGVILITTKRGVKGKVKVTYDFQYGGSAYVGLPQTVNSWQLASMYDQAQTDDGTPASGLKFSAQDIQEFKNGSDLLTHPNTDWIKAIFNQPGLWSSNNIALSGGTDDTKFNVSLGYLDQGGIMESTGYKRYTFRTNFDQRISRKLTTGFNLAVSQRNISDPPTVLGVGGETWYIHEAFQQWATDPIYTSNGNYAYPLYSGLNSNPVAYASSANGYSNNNNTRLMGTAFAEFEIIDGLKLKGIAATTRDYNTSADVGLGVDLYQIDRVTGVPGTTPNNTSASMPAVPSTTSVANGNSGAVDNDYQLLLNYRKTIKKSQFKGLLGYEARNLTTDSLGVTRTDLSDPALNQINAASPTNQTTYGNTVNYKSQSVFGRLNYIYDNKYLFEADARDDATSRFAPNYRNAIFPAFSTGWIISKEKFFNVPFISSLKLRASYGVLGNEQINDYQYLSTYVLGSYYIFNGIKTPGITEGPLANPVITWEKTTDKDIGLDASFFQNRLTFTGDYYIRDTRNILLNLNEPAILGATPPVANAGAVKNQGFDFAFTYKDRIGQLGYYVNGNFNYVKNEITDLAGTQYPGRELGDPIDNIYGYVAQGIFQNQAQITAHANQTGLGGTPQPGDIMYKDVNGDGVINASDEKSLGTYFPKITYGFSFGANYKQFDFSTVWSGVADVYASIAGSRLAEPFGDYGSSPITQQLNYWTPQNPGASYPRLSLSSAYNYIQSSFWVRNTSYLKLRNAQLGYTFPSAISQRLKISRLRVYLSGENLLLFSPFKLMDPESVTNGDPFFAYSGTQAYPTTKRYLAGVSVTF